MTCISEGLVSKVALAGGNFSVLLVSSNTLDCYSNSIDSVIMASDDTSDNNPSNGMPAKKMRDTNACMPNDMGTGSQNAVIQPLLTGMIHF